MSLQTKARGVNPTQIRSGSPLGDCLQTDTSAAPCSGWWSLAVVRLYRRREPLPPIKIWVRGLHTLFPIMPVQVLTSLINRSIHSQVLRRWLRWWWGTG